MNKALALFLLLFAIIHATAQQKIKEVLIMQHSHLDVGFTHLQPTALELQEHYIYQALDYLDRTSDYPEYARPKWTCEVTEPVMQWLENASEKDIQRFSGYLKQGRIAISALEYNTTPLASSEGLARQLYDADALAKRFGVKVNTANLHDATGLPWPIVDLFLDGGVEMLTMAINLHLSGTPKPRPAVYRWQSPGGRELLVMNGEHYSMFDQWTNNHTGSLDTVQAGLDKYLSYVNSMNYPYDFVYLSATCAPYAYDNSPPNFDLADIVKRWNEEGRQPKLRFVTPQDILARIREIPYESIPQFRGDWTDFWNFGCASSAAETKISLNTASNMVAADLLAAFGTSSNQLRANRKKIHDDINFYNEHTWGAWNPLEIHHPFPIAQWYMKAYPAYEGMALSKFVLSRYLQQLAGNDVAWNTQEGILLVNPNGASTKVYPRVPDDWFIQGKRIETWLSGGDQFERTPATGQYYNPVVLAPYSWKKVPFSELKPASPEIPVMNGSNFIETAYYKLEFDPASGKVFSLFDKIRRREVLDPGSDYGFFQFVHEKPDPSINPDRSAFHVRSVENERIGLTGWKPGWKAAYSSIQVKNCRVESTKTTATLIIQSEAEGTRGLEQKITLHADSPLIQLSAEFVKTENASPESIYFAFPLQLEQGWKGYFDTGDIPVELDSEQLPGSCRDWVTVSSFASIHGKNAGASLYCPDAPMVMFGDFNFGRNQASIPRQANPLLLGWATNNYWETNFRGSQPGLIRVNYSFSSQGEWNPVSIARESEQVMNPVITHPVSNCKSASQGQFILVQQEGIRITYVKESEDLKGIVFRSINLTGKELTATFRFPGKRVSAAWRCSTSEEKQQALEVSGQQVKVNLRPGEITSIRVE